MDEDAVLLAIGGLTEAVKNQGREIGEIKGILQEEAHSCRKCKNEIDKRLETIEDQHKGERAVVSFFDTLAGRVCTCLGIVSVSLALLALYVIPPALDLWQKVR